MNFMENDITFDSLRHEMVFDYCIKKMAKRNAFSLQTKAEQQENIRYCNGKTSEVFMKTLSLLS